MLVRKNRQPIKLRAKDRPLANGFLSDESSWPIGRGWPDRPSAGAGQKLLYLGRLRIWVISAPSNGTAATSSQAIVWDKHPVLTQRHDGHLNWRLWLERGKLTSSSAPTTPPIYGPSKVNPQSGPPHGKPALAVRAHGYSSQPGKTSWASSVVVVPRS